MNEQAPIRTRSWLFTPATRPERFAKAAEIGADVLLIDLEDAVAPRDKAAARSSTSVKSESAPSVKPPCRNEVNESSSRRPAARMICFTTERGTSCGFLG